MVVQQLTNLTRNHEVVGSIPALAQGVKDPHCRELWCRSQRRLGSQVAVAVAQVGGYGSDQTPAWEPPYAAGAALEKAKDKSKKKQNKQTNKQICP